MGDLVTEAVAGTLYYAGASTLFRIRESNVDKYTRASLFADVCRLNTLYMIARAGSGHIGSSFSSLDIVTWLFMEELKKEEDVYFSSKGHDAPGLYSLLIGMNRLEEAKIHQLRQLGGLPGHPDVHVDGMEANTGSLGMGISKAKGMAYAYRRRGVNAKLFVMTGDGELQEGQIWESLVSAANRKLGELVVIVDHNKFQSDYSVERTSSLGDLRAKFEAFGWRAQEIDGHDCRALDETLRAFEGDERPKAIIAHTVKGKGVSFMEGTSIDSDVDMFKFHSGAPTSDDYTRAVQELIGRINQRLADANLAGIELESVQRPAAPAAATPPVRLFPAYTDALIAQAADNDKIVALDADLALDMGLIPFAERFPDRFVECGIAEMDMVSQAGGMALKGLLPVVHSFSCFLSTRPNEQIYTNATERTKIVYVGGLSGVLPAGPGHSHQSVREISALGSVPGMVMVEPAHPSEVGPLLDWCLNEHNGPSFLRMISIPYAPCIGLAGDWKPVKGRGRILRDGADAVIVTSGLVMTRECEIAADLLEQRNMSIKLVALPWLNVVDASWLAAELGPARLIVTVDNHYVRYGQGDAVIAALAEQGALTDRKVVRIGLEDVPPSGGLGEVLEAVGLNAAKIADRIFSAR